MGHMVLYTPKDLTLFVLKKSGTHSIDLTNTKNLPREGPGPIRDKSTCEGTLGVV